MDGWKKGDPPIKECIRQNTSKTTKHIAWVGTVADRMVMNAAVKLRRALLTLLLSADKIWHPAYNDINISIHYWIRALLSKHFCEKNCGRRAQARPG